MWGTHKGGQDPLSERRGDLLVADSRLFSFHVKVKVLRPTFQESLRRQQTQRSRRRSIPKPQDRGPVPVCRTVGTEEKRDFFSFLFKI